MTVLAAVQSAAPYIGVAVPSVLFTGTDRTSIELQECANEAAKGIVEDFDWQKLRTVATITGDGTDESFDLPSDYFRMLKKARFWPSTEPNNPIVFIIDSDQWLGMDVQDFETVERRATIYGGQVHIKPAVDDAATVKYFYISNKTISATGSSTLTKTDFTVDSDSFFLGDRILKLAMIWRWKASKGRPYAEDMANYNAARDILAGNDRGSKMLHLGKNRFPSDVNIAYPRNITV